jgi:hypothetical protein
VGYKNLAKLDHKLCLELLQGTGWIMKHYASKFFLSSFFIYLQPKGLNSALVSRHKE